MVTTAQAAVVTKDSNVVTFGIVPQQSATKLAEKWTPISNYLSEKTGYHVHFKTAKDIPTFEDRCYNGEYDIAYMNPYHYTIFHEFPGYQVFAREKLKLLKGIIVTRKDSPYKNLEELTGNTLAFPSPAAFAASILPRAHLSNTGIHVTPKYVSSHDSVYRTVARGLYPAGGGIPRTFNNMDPETKNQLRILWSSKGYTPHAFAAHPKVSKEVVHKLQQTMIAMSDNPEGKKLLEDISCNGLISAEDSEWADIRKLGINVFGQKTSP